jgi:peptidoglycan/LPS O-acetylase OafA/YrhL
MQEWWSYRPGDFLLFSPRTYWRLFQLANERLWPLQIPVLLIGAAILAMLFRPRAWADRAIPAVLAAAWLCVSVGFLWMHYATINWAAVYFVPVFVGEALLVLWFGTVRGRLAFAAERGVAGVIGIALYVYALALHPLVALVAGRPLPAAEVIGIAPDPTAIGDARSPVALRRTSISAAEVA